MRFVAFIFFLLVSVTAISQQNITAKTITLSQYMKLRGVRVDSISIDGTFSTPSHFTLPTTRAVYDFIQALNVIPDWSDITNIPAGFADGVDNVDDADNSPTNELQSLSIAGDSLGISGGNKVRIPTADSLSQLVNDAGYITKSLYTDSDTLPTGRTAYVQDTFQFVLDAFLTTIKVGAQYNVYDVNFWGSDFKSWGTYYEGISGQGFSGTDGYSFIRDARNEENTSHEYFGAGTVERYVSNGDETVTEGIAADEYSLSATNGTNTGSLSVTGNATELVTTSTGTSEISRVQSLGNGAMLSTTQGTQVGRVYAERDHIQSAIIVDGTPIVAIEHEIGDTSITVHNESGKGMEYDEEPTAPTDLTLVTKGYVDGLGGVTGSGASGQVAVFNGTNTVNGTSSLQYNGTSFAIGGNPVGTYNGQVPIDNGSFIVGTATKGYFAIGPQADYRSSWTNKTGLIINTVALKGDGSGGLSVRNTSDSGYGKFSIGTIGIQSTARFGGDGMYIVSSGAASTHQLLFKTDGNVEFARFDDSGYLGLGLTTLSARLHIAAGTATASTAPIKLTSGTNLTTPEAGAVEFDGSRLYITNSTPTRKTIAYTDDPIYKDWEVLEFNAIDSIPVDTFTRGGFAISPQLGGKTLTTVYIYLNETTSTGGSFHIVEYNPTTSTFASFGTVTVSAAGSSGTLNTGVALTTGRWIYVGTSAGAGPLPNGIRCTIVVN